MTSCWRRTAFTPSCTAARSAASRSTAPASRRGRGCRKRQRRTCKPPAPVRSAALSSDEANRETAVPGCRDGFWSLRKGETTRSMGSVSQTASGFFSFGRSVPKRRVKTFFLGTTLMYSLRTLDKIDIGFYGLNNSL